MDNLDKQVSNQSFRSPGTRLFLGALGGLLLFPAATGLGICFFGFNLMKDLLLNGPPVIVNVAGLHLPFSGRVIAVLILGGTLLSAVAGVSLLLSAAARRQN